MKDALGHGSNERGGSLAQNIQARAKPFGAKYQALKASGVRDGDAAQAMNYSGQGAAPAHPAMAGGGNRGAAGPINASNIDRYAAVARRAQANHDLGEKLTKMGFFGKS
jgi:hypothetical protein